MPKRDVDEMEYTQDSEIDEKGETKVDEDGELLEGKSHKLRENRAAVQDSNLYSSKTSF